MSEIETESAESMLRRTEFIVDATSFERMALWSEWHDTDRPRRDGRRVAWEQISAGWTVPVGKIGDRQVILHLSWAKIRGKLVCFVNPVSRIVCKDLIDAFLEPFDRPRCDAMNFNTCLRAIGAL